MNLNVPKLQTFTAGAYKEVGNENDFYLKDEATDKFRRVSKKAAMDFMKKTHGKGSFEKRVGEAMKFPPCEPTLIFIWEDFQIKKFCREEAR